MAGAEKKHGEIRAATSRSRKLLINERVEVRSTEDGLHGSWHSGQVIGYKDQVRHVIYDDFVNEDGLGMVEDVRVSPVLDGLVYGDSSYVRCKIRPLPPPSDLQKESIRFGVCVDVRFNDAWWEGVVFDHAEGSDERRVFFPDMGDDLTVKIEVLRITQDWDEVTGEWRIRRKWPFLKILEEVERYWPLAASARQIWFEIQVKLGWVDWTCPSQDFWKSALRSVLQSSYELLMKQIVQELDSTGEFESWVRKLPDSGFWFTPRHEDLVPAPEDEHVSICSASSESMHMVDLSDVMADEVQSAPLAYPRVSVPSILAQGNVVNVAVEAAGVRTRETRWSPFDTGIVPQCFPGSVDNYLSSKQDIEKVRNHLAFLGWNIETAMFGTVRKWRYISPGGHAHYSLRQVCLMLQCATNHPQTRSVPKPVEQVRSVPKPRNDGLAAAPVIQVAKKREETGLEEEEEEEEEEDMVEVEKVFCLRAVEEYTKLEENCKAGRRKGAHGEESLLSKAKKHLSAVGWTFQYVIKRWNNKEKREMRYVPPNGGRKFNSLVTACRSYLEEQGDNLASSSLPDTAISNWGQIQAQDTPLRLAPRNEPKQVLHGIGKGAILQPRSEGPDSSSKKAESVKKDDFSVRVQQPASIRPCQVVVSSPAPQTHSARSIFPRMIDANMVLPGAKVHYRNKSGLNLLEGRISREGIICSCCDEVVQLSRFEEHAKSKYHRPSAHIFLEDGRSIADCQRQLKSEKQTSELNQEKGNGHEDAIADSDPGKSNEHEDEDAMPDSDYICSVCHTEGDLILCDQCPSSFHTGCVGLKDVPAGTWFCPSCCCRSCNLVAVKHYKEEPSEESYLHCGQCEHRYHVKCLRSNGFIQPGTNWFCSSRCEQIHLGLQKLLGKPIYAGRDDLACTLLKSKHNNGLENECLAENYCKLNTALGIMRECFEPVREARSGRDIVQDAIFNERSDLHRLNFLGFYIIALERNKEIITVALLRIHGEKIAEMPLIATRFQYRRMGMCRILMNELEKKLMELGVERLILPASPSVLETWENSFGFSRMPLSERLNFLGYTFLDFQGTTLCHKLFQNTPPPDFRQPPEAEVFQEDETRTDDVAEVKQAKQALPQHVDHPLCTYDKAMEEWDEISKAGGEPRCKRRKHATCESQNTPETRNYEPACTQGF